MSIAKRPDGTWRLRYKDPTTGKMRAEHFRRKVDALERERLVIASVTTGSYIDPKAGRVTLAEFYAGWAARQVWASGTVKAMDLAMRSCDFADLPFAQLMPSHAQAWVKAMDSRGLAPGTIKTRVSNVGGVVRAAVRDKLLADNPLDGVQLPRVRRQEHAMSIPTPEVVGQIIDAAVEWFQPFIAICAFAGLRLGEAAAVQIGDIDFLRRQLHVRRQVQRAGAGSVEISLPKYGSERTVYLPDELLLLLSKHRAGHPQWMFAVGSDLPPHQNTVGYWWRKTLRDAGVEPLKLHDLRHFYASGLIAAGCDVVTVQRALGHAKATTTLSTYAHLWPTAEDRTRVAASDLMRAATNRARDFSGTLGASGG